MVPKECMYTMDIALYYTSSSIEADVSEMGLVACLLQKGQPVGHVIFDSSGSKLGPKRKINAGDLLCM